MTEQLKSFDATAFLLEERNRQVEEFVKALLDKLDEEYLKHLLSDMVRQGYTSFTLWNSEEHGQDSFDVPLFLWNHNNQDGQKVCKTIKTYLQERYNLAVSAKLQHHPLFGSGRTIQCQVLLGADIAGSC